MSLPETTTPEDLARHMGKTMIDISQEELKALLRYEPETGLFFWVKDVRYGRGAGDVAGFVTVYGYVNIKIKQKAYPAHRLAFLYMTGRAPLMIDHANMDRSDNRFDNLRPATAAQNNANRRVMPTSLTGLKGVTKSSKNKYRARLCNKSIGFFASPEEAHEAYVKAAAAYFGEYARRG